MDLAELKTRLERGENLNTEFKQWPLQPDDLAAAIVAFANTDGGQILIGVNDRNPMIYAILIHAGLVTDAGTGIPRLVRLTQQAVGRAPNLFIQGPEFVLSIPRPAPA